MILSSKNWKNNNNLGNTLKEKEKQEKQQWGMKLFYKII